MYDEGKLEIKNLSVMRFWFALAINAGRGVIAALLCYYGIQFVGYTLALEDLILNAVALEFVISIDEMIFEALMPRAIKQFYERLKPLKLPPFTSYRGIDLRGAVTFLAVGGVFAAALGWLVIPQVGVHPEALLHCASVPDATHSTCHALCCR